MTKHQHIQKMTRREGIKKITFLLASISLVTTQQACEGVSEFENDPTNGYWRQRVEEIELEYPTIHTQETPGNDINNVSLAEKVNAHVPRLTPNGALLILEVGNADTPHKMEDGHFISVVYLKNQDGDIVFLREINPRTFESGKFDAISLPIPPNSTELTPYALCNLHELWEGKTLKAQ